jgi:uncharacterized protein DUF4115
MPVTSTERIVFILGLCAIGTLAVLISLLPKDRQAAQPGSAKRVNTSLPAALSVTSTLSATAATAPTRPAAPPGRAALALARLLLTATRGDTWLAIRSDSAQGKVLFSGVLKDGRTVTAVGRQLWVRVGAAANLDARLNGSALALPSGTFSAIVGKQGLSQLPGG